MMNEALFLMLQKLLDWLKNVTEGLRLMVKKGIRVLRKRKKMTHFWSIVVMMKEVLHLMLTVMMNKCYQLAIIVFYAEFVIL